MTIHNIIKTSLTVSLTLTAMTSCNDFLTITPSDKTVLEDYWQKGADVDEMVTGAYKSMLDEGLIERLIVWGSFRSDEMERQKTYNNTDLDNINAINLLPGNPYNSWDALYKVINNCNIVLNHAPAVVDIDPDFTDGDLQVVRAQMLSLRSLCYFYLVRTFRDVPYSTEAFEHDDQNLLIPQSAPADVLQHCIDDLLEAEKYAYRSGTFGSNNWKNVGIITRDAIYAMLTDIYLWRASMTHNTADYQAASDYAGKCISSKVSQNSGNTQTEIATADNPYHLETGQNALYRIFGLGNDSRESILELQFDGNNNANNAVCKYYFKSGGKTGDAHGRLTATQLYNATDNNANTDNGQKFFATSDDYRFWNNIFDANNHDETQFDIRKMIEISASVVEPVENGKGVTGTLRSPDNFAQNWIIYRLTDVMLMKAEADVQLAAGDNDKTTLRRAFELVKAVNDRSLKSQSKDSLKFDNFAGRNAMEQLVLAERARELSFEGKRWYDLMRYSYRHMEGTDASRTLYDIDPTGAAYPKLYDNMLKLILRKYATGGDAVSYKMKNEAYLYFPISQTETKVNKLLHQNPVYIEDQSTEKN